MTSCCPKNGDNHPASCECRKPSVPLTPDFPMVSDDDGTCCGSKSIDTDSIGKPYAYRSWGFGQDLIPTPAGAVCRVRTHLTRKDRLGNLWARLGIGRDQYGIRPGIYAVGTPQANAPVMVTANYKLSFDVLRSCLAGTSAWILVVDTRGINVWCAAGKGTFSTREVVRQVQATGLADIVDHRRLVLPQLAATGVCAREVKALCGFKVVWGPVHARHIKAFMDNQMKATPQMRKVTFSLRERLVLVPVELNQLGKPSLYIMPLLFVLSGIGPGVFSINAAASRGAMAILAYIMAIFAGAVLGPALLPWLPGRAFAVKGAVTGATVGAMLPVLFAAKLAVLEMLALVLLVTATSSYLAMNFTGATPYTSPTGVEKEMRKAIPAQALGALVAVALWVGAGFLVN